MKLAKIFARRKAHLVIYRLGLVKDRYFIEVKDIHNGCVQYGRPYVQNNSKGAAATQYFQSKSNRRASRR